MEVHLSNCDVGVGRMATGGIAVMATHRQSGIVHLIPLTDQGAKSLKEMLEAAIADVVIVPAHALPKNGGG